MSVPLARSRLKSLSSTPAGAAISAAPAGAVRVTPSSSGFKVNYGARGMSIFVSSMTGALPPPYEPARVNVFTTALASLPCA